MLGMSMHRVIRMGCSIGGCMDLMSRGFDCDYAV